MYKDVVLYSGFAASMGVIQYPVAWFNDTVMMLNMKYGSLGWMKNSAVLATNAMVTSLIACAIPAAAGFDLPTGKTKLIIHAGFIPFLTVLLGTGNYTFPKMVKGLISSLGEKNEKEIERISTCIFTATGAWLTYMSLLGTRAAHLSLFA